MVKLRLTGTLEQLHIMHEMLLKNVIIVSETKPVKNRSSNFYRIYITIDVTNGGILPCVK